MGRLRLLDAVHTGLRGWLAPLSELAALVPDGASVLELGCGQGLVLKLLAPRCPRLVGIDFDPRKCQMAREVLAAWPAIEIHEDDIFGFLESLEPGAFDFLVLSDTLSSFTPQDQDQLLRLVVSRLGPRGTLLLSFVDDDAGFKKLLALGLSKLIYGLRASRSAQQRFTYQSSDALREKLGKLGCTVDLHNLHRFPPRPIPHIAQVARMRAQASVAAVRFVVLNFRVGGQVSSVQALAQHLQARGARVRWALPDGCATIAKTDIDHFSSLGGFTRFARIWRLLRQLRPASREEVLHLVLPSPAFSFLAMILRWPENRVVLHYEGPALHVDGQTIAAAKADPALILPRLVLNNAALGHLGKDLRVTHLSSHPAIHRQVQAFGYARAAMIENLVDIGPQADGLPRVDFDRSQRQVWIAYVGHAHEVKGISVLVDAFERAAPRRPELHLLLALTRDGNAEKARRRLAQGPHADRVRNVGLIDIGKLLEDVDALVLPYVSALTTTLYPSLLLEADAARCPLIVSDLPELDPVLVRDAATLSIVIAGDRVSLEEAFVRLPLRTTRTGSAALRMPAASDITDRAHALYTSLAA